MPINILTIDVEEYFQVTDFEGIVEESKYKLRLRENLSVVLDLLNGAGVKATFFILGNVAKREPNLVKRICNFGHEVACHGYNHRLIYNQKRDEFKKDVSNAKRILEEISGNPVIGYRAPSFSITKASFWALDILAELGFKYDSSVFPIIRKRYGIPGFSRFPIIVKCQNGMEILEVPISTIRLGKLNIPFSGGGYLRLLPYNVIKCCIKNLNKKLLPAIIYFHPWELDPDQPRIKAGAIATFRHYYNITGTKDKITRLLRDFSFAPMRELAYNFVHM